MVYVRYSLIRVLGSLGSFRRELVQRLLADCWAGRRMVIGAFKTRTGIGGM